MKKILLALGLLCLSLPALAQTTVTKGGTFGSPCSPTSCTGFYAGGWLAGNGTNADILGSGLSGSVFAGGIVPGFDAGYQFSNGTYFLAGEVGIGDQLNIGNLSGGESGYLAYEIVKAGGSLSGLLGVTGSINVPTALTAQLISPYVLIGAVERPFADGWASGAGATFDISPKVFLDLRYMYVNYGAGTNAGSLNFNNENLIQVSLNYKF